MQAARVTDAGLRIEDVPPPEPGDGEALVRVSSSGVCHSDLHLLRRDWGEGMSSALGHEAIGVVEALGPGADRFVQVGDRVILGLGGLGGYWCGACEYCLRGETHLCDQRKQIIGTFAEEIALWAGSLVKLPDVITDREAPLACGGLTAYGAVKKLFKHQITPGRPIAVIGAAGGLGHYAVQLATLFGYRVVGVDVGAERGCPFFDDAPVVCQRIEALDCQRCADGQQADAVLAGQPSTCRRGDGGDRKRNAVLGVRGELQPSVEQFMGGCFGADGLTGQQADDDVEVGLKELAGVGGRQPDHRGIGGQRARAHPADHPPVREVIEQHQAVGHPQRVVVGQRDDPGAEADALGALRGRRDENLW